MYPNTEAIYREFPFIEKHCDRRKVKKARVSRVTKDLLDKRAAGNYGSDYDPFCFSCYGKIMLFNQSGKLLGRVGRKFDLLSTLYWIFYPLTLWFCPPPYSKESIGQALLRFGNDVHFIVWLMDNNYDYSPGSLTDGDLVVFKPPKGYTIKDWYEMQITLAEKAIRADVSSIDRNSITNRSGSIYTRLAPPRRPGSNSASSKSSSTSSHRHDDDEGDPLVAGIVTEALGGDGLTAGEITAVIGSTELGVIAGLAESHNDPSSSSDSD